MGMAPLLLPMARLRLIGSNHRLAPPSLLERLSSRAEKIQARLLELCERGDVRGALLVPTCNRLEVLLEIADEAGEVDEAALLGDDVPLRTCKDEEAVDTMLAVTSGLHSMVFGEAQILGQVREAFRKAETLGLLSRRLQMLRTRLLPAARDLRRRVGLDQRPASVASMAVDQVVKAGTRIAIVGAGETGRLLMETLDRRHVRDVLVVNRSLPKADALARHFGGRAMSLVDFRRERPELDGIVYAVRSDKALLDREAAEGLHTVVDISQPSVLANDLREHAGSEELPRVISLDELSKISAEQERAYAETREVGVVEARAVARRMWKELESGRPDLGKVVDLHIEGALAELEQAFGSRLSHLDDAMREELRLLMTKTAKRNAHIHIQDLKRLRVAR